MSPFQISTCIPGRHPTSWAKTRRSRALSGLPLARTTSAQTSLKITGSMVGMLAGLWRAATKLLCALGMVIGIPQAGNSPLIHVAGAFIRMPSPKTGATPTGEFTACQVHGLSHTAA